MASLVELRGRIAAGGRMIAQIAIAFLSPAAVLLSHSEHARIARWGSVLGLAGQPFWIASTWAASQWGMFVVSIIFTLVWSNNFRAHWIRRPRA